MDFNTADDKARRFKELHADPGVFVTPNPWDAGSALALAQLGYKALATSRANAARVAHSAFSTLSLRICMPVVR